MLLTWQAFVLQDHVKDLPITEQKRQFLAHQLEYDNMMRQKLILENANANSNASGAGGGGGGTPMGDLLITFFCLDTFGDGWTGTAGSQGTCNLIHPTKGIVDVGFDNSSGAKPPWSTIQNFPTGTNTGGSVPSWSPPLPNLSVVYPITIIERNIPYPTKQYGIQVITQNNYHFENQLIVSAGWSPYPNRNRYPNVKPVYGVGGFVDANIRAAFTFAASTTYNLNFPIEKLDGGSSSTSGYTGNKAWIRNVVYI